MALGSRRQASPSPLRWQQQGEVWALSGQVDFGNANQVLREGLDWLHQQPSSHLTLDLSRIEEPTTLTLAVLMQWLRAADQRQQSLSWIGVPAKLAAIVYSAHLDDLLDPAERLGS